MNPRDQEQEVEKPEVLEQDVLEQGVQEQDDIKDDEIQKREAEDLMKDNAIDPEQEESQKKSKNLFLACLNKKTYRISFKF